MLEEIVQIPKAVKVRKMQINKNLLKLHYLLDELALESRHWKGERGGKSSGVLLNFLLKNVRNRNYESSVHTVVLTWEKVSKLKYELCLKSSQN